MSGSPSGTGTRRDPRRGRESRPAALATGDPGAARALQSDCRGSCPLLSEVSPIDYESSQGRISSTVGLLPTLHVLGTSFSAGPRLSIYWADGSLAAGAEVRVGFLQDRLALGLGARDFPLRNRNVFILLSLADLNGVAYWMLPGLGR